MSQAWVWAGARAIGTAHLAQGLPCQDAFVCRIWQEGTRPAVLIAALADGAGSAECAEIGAQLATSLVANIVSEQLMEGTAPDRVANVLRCAVGEARLALQLQAGHAGRVIDDYACTLLVAILCADGGIVGQIGDGAVVIDDGDQGWHPVHWPDHGEYANTTHFLTEPNALEVLQLATLDRSVRRVCLFSDGLERLVLDFRDRSAHAPFFDAIFSPFEQHTDAGHAARISRDLEALLGSDKINCRTDDDKSLVCAALLAT
jgi:Protein phosphatase 2C